MKDKIIELLKDNLIVWISQAQYADNVLQQIHDAQTMLTAQMKLTQATEKIYEINDMIRYINEKIS